MDYPQRERYVGAVVCFCDIMEQSWRGVIKQSNIALGVHFNV